MYVWVYLIIGFIILTYLLYRTITNIIRYSKGLPTKKYRFMYSYFNGMVDEVEMFVQAIFLSAFWVVHWAGYIIYKCCKHIILPLLTRLTLSKEERVQVVLGATPNKKGDKQ